MRVGGRPDAIRVEDVPFPKPGVLYRIWINDDQTEATYESVGVTNGHVERRIVSIGVDGPGLSESIVFGPAEELQQHLEWLWSDQVWRRTGELVGPYASPAVDLDSLEPAAKKAVLDEFAADLEARREPLSRFRVGSREPEPVSVSAPVAPPSPPRDPQYEPYKVGPWTHAL